MPTVTRKYEIKKKNILFFIILFLFTLNIKAQSKLLFGEIRDKIDNTVVSNAEIYNESGKLLALSDSSGHFEFYNNSKRLVIIVFTERYEVMKKIISNKDSTSINIFLEPLFVKFGFNIGYCL